MTKRVCEICGARLSRYSSEDRYCWLHRRGVVLAHALTPGDRVALGKLGLDLADVVTGYRKGA